MDVLNYMSNNNTLIQMNESSLTIMNLLDGNIEVIKPLEFKYDYETFFIEQETFDLMYKLWRLKFRFDEERFPHIYTEQKNKVLNQAIAC